MNVPEALEMKDVWRIQGPLEAFPQHRGESARSGAEWIANAFVVVSLAALAGSAVSPWARDAGASNASAGPAAFQYHQAKNSSSSCSSSMQS